LIRQRLSIRGLLPTLCAGLIHGPHRSPVVASLGMSRPIAMLANPVGMVC
jgi:hypothetical protein